MPSSHPTIRQAMRIPGKSYKNRLKLYFHLTMIKLSNSSDNESILEEVIVPVRY